jgi:hypothetical protein
VVFSCFRVKIIDDTRVPLRRKDRETVRIKKNGADLNGSRCVPWNWPIQQRHEHLKVIARKARARDRVQNRGNITRDKRPYLNKSPEDLKDHIHPANAVTKTKAKEEGRGNCRSYSSCKRSNKSKRKERKREQKQREESPYNIDRSLFIVLSTHSLWLLQCNKRAR